MSEKPLIPSPQRLRIQQQLIIRSFGLANVAVEAGLLAGVGAASTASLVPPNQNNLLGKIGNIVQDQPLAGKTPLGTPVWTNLVITGDSYVDPVTGQTITIPACTFYSVLITLEIGKIVIKTDIQGRNNTIKEYISTKDAIINIKGGVFGRNGVRPIQDIANLKAVFKNANVSINAQAPIFNEWDISNFVCEDISIPESMGGYSFQLFEARCISDQDVILNLSGL